jgi:hypothetical protein
MVPVIFVGSLAFFIASPTGSGLATAGSRFKSHASPLQLISVNKPLDKIDQV